jgi:anti-sigma factor RsiW
MASKKENNIYKFDPPQEVKKRWKAISALVDGELSPTAQFDIKQKIDNDRQYQKTYEQIIQIKNLLKSLTTIKASEDFEEKLYKLIESGKMPDDLDEYLPLDEKWELVSKFVDDELKPKDRFMVEQNIENDAEFNNNYQDILNIKNFLKSAKQIKADDDFMDKLKNRIDLEKKNSKQKTKIIDFNSNWFKTASAVAAVAMLAIVFAFAAGLFNEPTLQVDDSDGIVQQGRTDDDSSNEYTLTNDNSDIEEEIIAESGNLSEEKAEMKSNKSDGEINVANSHQRSTNPSEASITADMITLDEGGNSGSVETIEINDGRSVILPPDEVQIAFNMGNKSPLSLMNSNKMFHLKGDDEVNDEEELNPMEELIRKATVYEIINMYNFTPAEIKDTVDSMSESEELPYQREVIQKNAKKIVYQINRYSKELIEHNQK